jgi:protein SCO1/2
VISTPNIERNPDAYKSASVATPIPIQRTRALGISRKTRKSRKGFPVRCRAAPSMDRRKMLTSAGIAAAALVLAIVGVQIYQAWTSRHAYDALRGTPVVPERYAPDAVLVDQRGRPAPIVDPKVRATLVFFGFTHCKDTCPLALASLAKAYRTLPYPASVRVEMITVDPAHDDPATLRRFVTQFDPHFVGLTAKKADLESIWSAFGVSVDDKSKDIVHGDAIYLVDRRRKIVALYLPESGADDLAHDAQLLSP